MSRKVRINMYTTLDGFSCLVDGPDNPEGERQFWDAMWDGPMATADTILLGRTTYELWADFWPKHVDDDNPHWKAFARFSTRAEKVVFSRTLKSASWSNSRIFPGPVAKEISRLRGLPGGDIIVGGGPRFVQSVLAEELADELCLTVTPTIVGRGLPVFHTEPNLEHHDEIVPVGAPDRHDFRLLESRPFASGGVFLRYATSTKGLPTTEATGPSKPP